MNTVIAEFCHRVEGIPFHGVGLSADAYQPDFVDLMASLRSEGSEPDFAELFRAATPMLASIRRRYPSLRMPYHAEGLWLTRAGWLEGPSVPADLELAVEQVRVLQSPWLNHECASKIVAGYSFGTYLPPLFTAAVADLVAEQARQAQGVLDRLAAGATGFGPLLLLELPPLTYFGAGDLPVPEFFRRMTETTPCGLVLDIGHLWTHYRYGPRRAGEPLERFVERFLDEFPLDRVVEIHVAGLATHPSVGGSDDVALPPWIDAHGERVPAVLFDVLDQVLAHPRLRSVKGVALEVDTKPVDLIAEEFSAFRRRYDPIMARWSGPHPPPIIPEGHENSVGGPAEGTDRARVGALEAIYADVILGRLPAESWQGMGSIDPRWVARYREGYLRHEVLHWGGDLSDMFPLTCAKLARHGVVLEEFVPFWFARRRSIPAPFDYFTLKIEWFVDFVRECLPEVLALAEQEAACLRSSYEQANAPISDATEVGA